MKHIFKHGLAAALAFAGINVAAQTINDHALWNIRSDAGETRWIQIREYGVIDGEQIFHIDVYRRENGDVEEFYDRLIDHMAIEKEALLNSIGQAIDMGVPERGAYDKAVAEWARERPENRYICRSPIQRCMQSRVAGDF